MALGGGTGGIGGGGVWVGPGPGDEMVMEIVGEVVGPAVLLVL